MKTNVIAISGTSCSGKGTIVELCKNEFGFTHRSIRAALIEAGNKLLGIPLENIVTRDHFREIGQKLRAKHGPTCLVDFVLENSIDDNTPIIIESIRTPEELIALKSHPRFEVTSIFIDAPHKLRYEWSMKRNDTAEIKNNSTVTFEEFVERENLEWGHKEQSDKSKQNISAVSVMCDHSILNHGDKDELHQKVRELVKKALDLP